MIIKVKSLTEFFEKEKSGIKPNTVRQLDGKDTIEITNPGTGEKFTRTIKDISVFNENIIISFKRGRS